MYLLHLHMYMKKRSNKEVFILFNEKGSPLLLVTFDNRRGKLVGHLIRHVNVFEKNIRRKDRRQEETRKF